MPRSGNAQIAVDMYEEMRSEFGWSGSSAWHGIARLLLSCEVWDDPWKPFHGSVVYKEKNAFKVGKKGPNKYLRRAEDLSGFLARELRVSRDALCGEIATYWRQPGVSDLQPNNLVGHAFRSLTVHILETFGDKGVSYAEEVDPYKELLPGQKFGMRSKDPRIDIVARRGEQTVALISSRWRFRHDRVDVVEEAMAYAPAAKRRNPACRLYASVGEFVPNRLDKILASCPPENEHGVLDAAVHFAPQLILDGLGENGRTTNLRSLEWLINETYFWK